MNNDIFDTSFVNPEDVMLSEDKKQIKIIHTNKLHDYCLYNTQNTQQATPWVNGKQGQVVFDGLNPEIRYAIRVRKANDDSKPEIHYIHSLPLVDDEKE